MGTAGNKPGYKIFSFNTTVRNPKRNTEFLEVLKNFDDVDLTDAVKNEIYAEIIKRGIYRFTKTESFYCLIEVTLMKDYHQQVNSETTSISFHLRDLDVNKNKFSLLIAPYIHKRVVQFFRFCLVADKTVILAFSIKAYINLLSDMKNIKQFEDAINDTTTELNDLTYEEYADMMNQKNYK